jgi:hypothetical protein
MDNDIRRRLMSLYTWLSSSYVVVHMVVVVLCRCPHGCRRLMSLSTWLSTSYVIVHMVVVLLCRCPHGCRRLMSLSTWLSSSYLVVHMIVVLLCSCICGCRQTQDDDNHVDNDIRRRQPCGQRHKTTTTMLTTT